jgi:hypothetical protein
MVILFRSQCVRLVVYRSAMPVYVEMSNKADQQTGPPFQGLFLYASGLFISLFYHKSFTSGLTHTHRYKKPIGL